MKFKLYLIELKCFEVLRDVLIVCGLILKKYRFSMNIEICVFYEFY